ncbi:MAG TPA: Hsp20/alpha crystallin family protein [Chitinophagales bacterium]|nr:Hsp20/alpha crystallin family protein [Chitinophagales bacterium]
MTLLSRRFPSLLPGIFDEPFFNRDWIGELPWLSEVPPVNIIEKDNEFDVEVAAPGMKKEDFHVTCDDGMLTIKAEREEKKEEKEKNYTRREYNYNSFERSFTLPESVKADQVKAKYEDGVLRLTLPKKEEAKARPKREIKIA